MNKRVGWHRLSLRNQLDPVWIHGDLYAVLNIGREEVWTRSRVIIHFKIQSKERICRCRGIWETPYRQTNNNDLVRAQTKFFLSSLRDILWLPDSNLYQCHFMWIISWLYGCICKCKIYTTIYPDQLQLLLPPMYFAMSTTGHGLNLILLTLCRYAAHDIPILLW